MPTNTNGLRQDARRAEATPKSPARRQADTRLRKTRAYVLRNQGAVADGLDRSSQRTQRDEEADRRRLHEGALLVACIALAAFALWFLPVADTRFF